MTFPKVEVTDKISRKWWRRPSSSNSTNSVAPLEATTRSKSSLRRARTSSVSG